MMRVVMLAVVALFGIPLVGSFFVWRSGVARGVKHRLEVLKAASLPTSGKELDKWYRAVPNERNGALVMTQAFALLRTYSDERSNQVAQFKVPRHRYSLTTSQRSLLVDYVEMNRAALAKAGEAVALPENRYPVDLASGAYAKLPHLGELKTMARVAQLEILLALDCGETPRATRAVSSIMQIARTLDQEPVLVSQMVRVSLLRMGVRALELRLGAAPFNEQELVTLEQTLSTAEETNCLTRGIIGDRAICIPCFRMSWAEIQRQARAGASGTEPISGPPLPGPEPGLFRLTGIFERDLNFYLGVMETNIATVQQGPPQSLQLTNLDAVFDTEAQRRKYFFSMLLLPSISRTALREADAVADVRLARTALAVEAFRKAQNRLPEGLAELVPRFMPAVPPDPYDGAPLRYRLRPKGYVIYSIGRDGHDDGGREEPPRTNSTDKSSYDITFTVER